MEGPVKGIIGIAAGGIVAVMLAVIFKKEKEAFSVYINIIACILILIWGLGKLEIIIEAINKLKTAVNIPSSIKDAGISEIKFFDSIDGMSEEAFDDQCTGANPRYPLISEIKQMYINAFEGK